MDNEKLVLNREEYIEYFQDVNDDKTHVKQQEALKYALDIRKYEIDLYWKRATYFWAFIAASFTGYFVLANGHNKKVILIVSILGLIFSYSWYCVNRASKFWQNNWERHVDYLEDEIIGPLYKMVIDTDNMKYFKLVDEYPFSTSKINQLLSLIITFIWMFLIFDSLRQLFVGINIVVAFLIDIAIVSTIIFIYKKYGTSQFSHKQHNQDDAKFVVREIN